jgi:Cys-rich four helix bundle protein (predicted Tat secretion target)
MTTNGLDRRDVLAGFAGLGVTLFAARAHAEREPAGAEHGHAAHGKDAQAVAPPSPALQAVIRTTAACVRDGRFCLARCTDHLAAGTPMMAECQRAVMNMLAVVTAMGDVAGFRNAPAKDMKVLASACAAFCRSCEKACEPHAAQHEECKACMDACHECAEACEALAA